MADWHKGSRRVRSAFRNATGVLTKPLWTLFVILSAVLPARADALLPTVVLISPITILLLIPIIGVEAWYVSSRMKLRFWKATRVMALANVASTLIGFPITMAVSSIQHRVMVYEYGSEKANFDKWMTTGDQRARAFSFGHYPGWAFLLSAFATLIVCFLASWWVESITARWRLKQQTKDNQFSTKEISKAVRNANVLSYSLLTPIVLLFLARLSFPQF
jgi:hypothetical protein